MHKTSLNKMHGFVRVYLAEAEKAGLEIIDVGARSVNGSQTYRQLFSKPSWRYRGLDMEPGENVDILVKDPYNWKQLKASSIDVVISGQALEHIEFPWLTISEIKRVLRPGGVACLIAPSSGPEHCFPTDCWRIYPDGMRALASHGGLDVVEVFTDWGLGGWQDTFAVLQKPLWAGDGAGPFPVFKDRGVAHKAFQEALKEKEIEDANIRDLITENNIEFLDFGCSSGGSLEFSKKTFEVIGAGIGIDIDPNKVKLAIEAGHKARVYDILNLPAEKLVRFTVMSHFLEHVPDLNLVNRFIEKACNVSREFVFIRQPFFDADGYLMQKGLKFYWSHWRGHSNTMSSLDLYAILQKLKIKKQIGEFSIHARGKIGFSSDRRILPLSAPIDQHDYDPLKHPPKADIHFEIPVFCETVAFISMPGVDHYRQFQRFKVDATFYESDGLARLK